MENMNTIGSQRLRNLVKKRQHAHDIDKEHIKMKCKV